MTDPGDVARGRSFPLHYIRFCPAKWRNEPIIKLREREICPNAAFEKDDWHLAGVNRFGRRSRRHARVPHACGRKTRLLRSQKG
ncbi:hypothetical protein [Polycladomyces subterraneus]|uniref:Uncharacterized protein n=1 Tax=Polycladomyces subterraneus TaxID=1016997 RepID=A0ABT8IP85_9BACL|nr:hypothetical protein [Polycladomyces subterraneus]MDN4594574.1 hypothetical protein [Polycladomyces subterraneus]